MDKMVANTSPQPLHGSIAAGEGFGLAQRARKTSQTTVAGERE
jgi:hypothetical protein